MGGVGGGKATAPLPLEAEHPVDNPGTPERIDLGHKLFFEPRLSRSGVISCNTCHVVGAAGVDAREVAIGEGARTGPRNSPTVLNAAFLHAQFWDGRAAALEDQAKRPIQAHVEMDLTPDEAVERLRETGYGPFFEAAFPGEANPLSLFQESGCVGCHSGPLLGGRGYAGFSHVAGRGDVGREAVTGREEDRYVFRIAPLRNVAETAPYFHDGSSPTLRDAVSIMGSAQLGRGFTPDEVGALVAFLESLTGEYPVITHPQLPRGRSGGGVRGTGSTP